MKLVFGKANAKLIALEKKFKRKVFTFSVLSGFTCPYAKDCNSRAEVDSKGKRHIVDGPHTKFRCFSASQEALFTGVYNSRRDNGAIIELAGKAPELAAAVISEQLPKSAGILRIHVGGDFKTKNYFQAWLMVAHANPDRLFYAYTKSLPFWVWAKSERLIPENFILTASYGGYQDKLIAEHNLRFAKVVFSVAEARKLKLPIDHDDSHAADPRKADKSFALLIHGAQPKGSDASKAVVKLDGKGSYGKGDHKTIIETKTKEILDWYKMWGILVDNLEDLTDENR